MMSAKKRFLTRRRKDAKKNHERLCVSFAPLRLCARKVFLYVFVCALLFLAACNSNDPQPTPVITNPPSGTTYPMPPTRAASLANMGWELSDGKRSVFSEYKGKVLILDFYATWCAPCRDSIPHLIGLQKQYESQGLQVIGLNVGGPGDEQLVPAFAKQFGIQYPLARPDEDLVSFLLGDQDAIPQTFVFDRQGQLVQRFVGFGAETGIYIDSAVATALKTPAP
ncbi:MAG TPA: TlpA disulfide reductase family protein [Pyrinomonadaceae bacterium]|nr:TlpA disulfide reductase family protein [Pyrinomonadaceae bacterium]